LNPIAAADILKNWLIETDSQQPTQETTSMVQIANPPANSQSLSQLSAGAAAVVSEVRGAASDVSRLQALGVCQGRRVEMMQAGDPMIVRVVGSKVGLSHRLAESVIVCTEPCPAQAARV
jgi:Fe2+ transport system protein FeoA